ncbi:MAG TPA: hypothetical protein VNW92_15535 [Polyangiaceae bacterium]|nr:hypothetical protein [Polyangiaceae bacterium]
MSKCREQFPLLFVDVSSSASSSGAQQAAVLELLARHGADAAVVALVDEERPGELRSALAAGATEGTGTGLPRASSARTAPIFRDISHLSVALAAPIRIMQVSINKPARALFGCAFLSEWQHASSLGAGFRMGILAA